MNNRLHALALAALAIVFTGCNSAKFAPEASLQGWQNETAAPSAKDSPALAPSASGSTPMLAVAAAEQQRVVIYHAQLSLVVPDIAQTLAVIQQQAKAAGGYMQEISGSSITVRVPVGNFEELLTSYTRLGEVTSRAVKAQDITEEMRDLGIRLANAEAVRKRLLELVEKSTEIEATLKIEQELQRVTETIELLKGKIQYLKNQAAFSTIGIQLNSPLPQKQMVAQIPFEWVRSLGDGAVTGKAEAAPDTSRWRRRGIAFDLPPAYIRYYERDQTTEALAASGLLIKVCRHDNYEGGSLAFWNTFARKALVENRGFAITSETDATLGDKSAGKIFIASRDTGTRKTGYFLGIVASKRYVYTYEAWAELAEFTKDQAALAASFKTMKAH